MSQGGRKIEVPAPMRNCKHAGFVSTCLLYLATEWKNVDNTWKVLTVDLIKSLYDALLARNDRPAWVRRMESHFRYMLECKAHNRDPKVYAMIDGQTCRFFNPSGLEMGKTSNASNPTDAGLRFARIWGLRIVNMYFGPPNGEWDGTDDQALVWQFAPMPEWIKLQEIVDDEYNTPLFKSAAGIA